LDWCAAGNHGRTDRAVNGLLLGMSAYYFYNNHAREGTLLGVIGFLKFCLYATHLSPAECLYIVLSITALIVAVFLIDIQTGPIARLGRISYPLYLIYANVKLTASFPERRSVAPVSTLKSNPLPPLVPPPFWFSNGVALSPKRNFAPESS
jgi:peptidoglycan/LPS O-acetylase OafA/YrhL